MREEVITDWAVDDETVEEPMGSVEVEKGVWKKYEWIIYNQNEVDQYSCTVVATYTALSNLTGKRVGYDVMRNTLERMKKDGKFTPGFGAKLSDWVAYSLEDFNKAVGSSFMAKLIVLTPASIVTGLGFSPIVTGVKYGKKFLADTQDNAWIDGALNEVTGSQGHAICAVKVNTMDDVLVKLANTYEWKLVNNVIGVDFNKYRKLFFNTGYYFTK